MSTLIVKPFFPMGTQPPTHPPRGRTGTSAARAGEGTAAASGSIAADCSYSRSITQFTANYKGF